MELVEWVNIAQREFKFYTFLNRLIQKNYIIITMVQYL